VKRTVLVISLLVLLVLSLAVSTVAACEERESSYPHSECGQWLKVPVNATQAGGQISSSMEEKCGKLYINAQTAGTVKYDLNKDGTIDYTFNSTGNQQIIIKIKTGKGVIDFEPMRWVLLSNIHDPTTEIGAFEGNVHGTITGYTLTPKFAWTGVVHVVFCGSGVFEGQKLVLEGTRTKKVNTDGTITWNPIYWEGFLLKPKPSAITLSYNQTRFRWAARDNKPIGDWTSVAQSPIITNYTLTRNVLHWVIPLETPPKPGTEPVGNSTVYVYNAKAGVWIQKEGTLNYTSSNAPYFNVTMYHRGYLKFSVASDPSSTFVHGVMYRWAYLSDSVDEATVHAVVPQAVWDSKRGAWLLAFAVLLWDNAPQTYDTVAPYTNPAFPSPFIEPFPARIYNPMGL
jgi:hypothetical protein